MVPRLPASERASRVFKETQRYASACKAFGLRVRHLRGERSWTLEGASAAMDIDLKHLQKVEAGQLNLTLVTILRIADGLDVAPESLFAGIPPRSRRKARTKPG